MYNLYFLCRLLLEVWRSSSEKQLILDLMYYFIVQLLFLSVLLGLVGWLVSVPSNLEVLPLPFAAVFADCFHSKMEHTIVVRMRIQEKYLVQELGEKTFSVHT